MEHLPLKKNGSSPPETSESPFWVVYLDMIVRWKRFIFWTTIGSTLVALVISFLLPIWYLSSSTILMEQSSSMFDVSKLIGSAGGIAGDLLGKTKLSEDVDRYEAIFRSERLRLAVIDKFNLLHEYEFDEPDTKEPLKSTLKELAQNISFNDNKDGTITISAYYKLDSVKAAEMTNFIVAMMDSINRQLATESARNQRVFIEKRYLQALEELAVAEVKLTEFQKAYKVGELKEQVRASLAASAQIEALAVESEVEYNILRQSLGENHPQVFQAKNKSYEFRRQAKKFETGGLNSDMIIPLDKMPELGMDYLRFYRSVLLQTKIVEFLVPQYEQAKIQEAKDTPTLLVLDRARVPEWKAKPKRVFIVLGGFIAALLLSVFIALVTELFNQYSLKKPEESGYIRSALKQLTDFKSYTQS
ncbi:MAG: hypothetical protein SFU91_12485 [Chloroherpetonaceae bacterium]|nr:hypothetical protein [Chloroherpetonaceae bacterium]